MQMIRRQIAGVERVAAHYALAEEDMGLAFVLRLQVNDIDPVDFRVLGLLPGADSSGLHLSAGDHRHVNFAAQINRQFGGVLGFGSLMMTFVNVFATT